MALDVDFDVLEGPISQFSPGSYLSINRYFRIAAPFTGTKTETLSFGTLGNDYSPDCSFAHCSFEQRLYFCAAFLGFEIPRNYSLLETTVYQKITK